LNMSVEVENMKHGLVHVLSNMRSGVNT
jgi:hypothetical protein